MRCQRQQAVATTRRQQSDGIPARAVPARMPRAVPLLWCQHQTGPQSSSPDLWQLQQQRATGLRSSSTRS